VILRLRAPILFLLLLASSGIVHASSALLRLPAEAPAPVSLLTYSGKIDVNISPVTPSAAVTIVLLMDTITPQKLAAIKKDLLAAYTPARGAKLRVGLVQGGNLVFAGPFTTRVRFKAALDQVRLPASPASAPAAEAVVEFLFNHAAHFGSEWSCAVFIGNLPALDPGSVPYAIALLAKEFTAQHVRLSWLSPASMDGWLPLFRVTGGTLLPPDVHDLSAAFDSSGTFLQADWTLPAPSSGFVLATSTLKDASGRTLLEVPEIAAKPEVTLPTPGLYATLRAKAAEATALLSQSATAETAQQLHDDLKLALGINPRDPEALLVAAVLSERAQDYASAGEYRASIAEVRPLDGSAHAGMGHDYLLASNRDKAEAALENARRLDFRDLQLFEDLARLRIARKDDQGALSLLTEALTLDAKRQDLWFLKAQSALRLNDAALAISSLESGLALGGIHIDEAKTLIGLYIKTGQADKAGDRVSSTMAQLPAEAGVRTQFASALDELKMTAEALSAWRRVLEIQPASGQAHERIARLLLDAGDFAAAEHAADTGLAAVPNSAALYLVKSDALEKLGHLYDARRVVEQGAEAAPVAKLLERLAAIEETYVGRAAPVYQRWAELPGLSSEERVRVLQRGIMVALRDGDEKRARAFAAMLAAAGSPDTRGLLGGEGSAGETTSVFGGLAALSFMAHAKESTQPEKFFVGYSRALIERAGPFADQKAARDYLQKIEQYLQKLAVLEKTGKAGGQSVEITLSLQDKAARARTENVLGLLGIRLRNSKAGVELDLGESKSQAAKQETFSALAIDQVGMQEAFQKNRPFTFDIPYERAAIYPNEKMWLSAFPPDKNQAGGFAGVLLRSLNLARLYVGMSSLDRETIAQLLEAVDLRTLHNRYSELFFAFAPAFAVRNGHAVCPGGPQAEAIWEQLAGTSPARPGAFFRALLERDDGKLLAYFYTLSHLDPSRQTFFTANFSRTEQFYRLFSEFKERERGPLTLVHDSSFQDFLRSIPLATNGHVDFPGSPAVWMVAKGSAAAESKMSKLSKASARWTGTEIEDEVLLRLARTRYHDKEIKRTELNNFLAVAQIDAHRSGTLDDEAALLLAQRYGDQSASYAYFTELTALNAADFRNLFDLFDGLHAQSPLQANIRLGELHALVQWICLLRERQVFGDEEAARLFRTILKSFATSDASIGYAAASLDAVRAILASCKAAKAAGPDDAIRSCLVGSSEMRDQEFQRVLELQKVPSLALLFKLSEAARSSTKTSAEYSALSKVASNLAALEAPAKVKMSGKEKEQIALFNPGGVEKTLASMAQKAGGKHAATDLNKLGRQLLAELEPQVELALAAVVYAYYLRPSDLIVAEDPLLLRKHRFLDFSAEHNPANLVSFFQQRSESSGSYFLGGFAEFAVAAGSAAQAGWKMGNGVGEALVSAQIAAIRSTPWDLLTESDLRLLGLRIAVAREWIVQASLQPQVYQALGRATVGLLSLSRRADLLNGVTARSWAEVWDSMTLPDLFALGGSYLEYFKSDVWTSPVTAALRVVASANDGSRLRDLGPVRYLSLGCNHAHWTVQPPYEDYELRMFPAEDAERWAEFQLFLAFQADQVSGQAAALSRVAEPLAAKAFRSTQMTDFHDWRSLFIGYTSVTAADLERALQQ
jgi:tetratricopeptide (TPR) repeat protein